MSPQGKKTRLTRRLLIAVLSVFLPMLLLTVFLGIRQLGELKRNMHNSMNTVAEVMGKAMIAELRFGFGYKEEAEKNLRQLGNIPVLLAARVYQENGEIFAEFHKDATDGELPSALAACGTRFLPGVFQTRQPIIMEDRVIGSICLIVSTRELDEQFRTYLLSLIGILMLIVLLASLLTWQIRKIVVNPILKLVSFFGRVSRERNYALRMELGASGEIGVLYEGFNDLMEQVYQHEQEASRHREELESLVASRTQDLRRSNDELRKLSLAVQDSPSLVVMTDPEGHVAYVNPKFEVVTGFAAEEVQGRTSDFLSASQLPADVYQKQWEALRAGREWRGEVLTPRKGRPPIWVECLISSTREEDGTISHYILVGEDISLRKEAEAQMVRAKEEAERANRLKSEFLANMSHEIRTPMNAILGFARILENRETDPEKGHHLDIISTSGENLLNLINDILDFSKIEADRLELDPAPFSPARLLGHVDQMFRMKAREKGLNFTLDLEQHLPDFLLGDAHRLNQIMVNIVGNALKFTERGGITLRGLYPEGVLIMTGGTGLGLAIARKMVRLMNGDILLESQEQVGSRFTVRVPLAEVGDTGQVVEEMLAGGGRSYHGDGKTIAIIDDNPNDRELLGTVLMRSGYRTVVIDNQPNVVERVVEEKVELILLDLVMEGLDGIRINELLKRDIRTAHIPVIVCSGSDALRNALFYGVLDCVPKHAREEEILQRIYQALNVLPPVRNVLVLEDDDYLLHRYAGFLNQHHYSTFAFKTAQEALDWIRNGLALDLIVLDLTLPEVDGFMFLDRLHQELKRDDIPVVVVTGRDLSREDLEFLKPRTLSIFQKGSNTEERFLSFVDGYFSRRSRSARRMVSHWFERMRKDAGEGVAHIVREGIASLPDRMEKMGEAIAREDWQELGLLTHSLKGVALNLSMDEIASLARGMNDELRRDLPDIDRVRFLFVQLRHLLADVDFEGNDSGDAARRKEQQEGISILVAEDDPINQELIRTYFRELNRTCDVASNGQEALEMLRQKDYQVLFLDMQMPVMGGEETVQAIRRDPGLKHLHVIALTAHAIKGDAERYVEAGCDEYLSKPLHFSQFSAKMKVLEKEFGEMGGAQAE